jgi:hypothetical protein
VYTSAGKAGRQKAAAPALGTLQEEDEEEDEDEEGSWYGSYPKEEKYSLEDIPQAFSHFTWSSTDGKLLVCDLQGTWNAEDGFVLTDPAFHSWEGRARTNHGRRGMDDFFKTHQCSALCRQLGLKPYSWL